MRNETFFKRQWKIAVMALLFIVLVASILYTTIPTIAYAKEVDFAENTIQRRIPTLNDDFDDSKVIVVLNQKNSKYNGVVRIEDFKIDVEKASLVNTQQTERLDRGDDSVTDAVKTGQAVVTDLFRVDNAKSSSLVRESEFFQILSIDLPIRGKEKVLEAIAELEKSEIVYSAEPDYRYETIDLWVPNDTNYATNQWGLTGTNGIQAANTWDMTRGLADIRVGLFETGAQQNHPDLNGRFLAPNFTLGNADHGTHVAGIVGAISNNNQGVAGVSQSNMMLLNRNSNDFVDSMARAANNNIWVINASYEYTSGGVIENHAVAIHNYQGLLVCAAGNSTADIDNATNRRYPAGYSAYTIPRKTFLGIETQPARPITNVITVGSIDNGGGISSFSNWGETHVQLFAPGGNILSAFPEDRCALGNETLTHPETGATITVRRCESWVSRPGGLWARSSTHHADGYHFMSGTSMAAPHVAGVAALIRAINQNLTPQQIKAAILDNVDTATGLSGLCSTGGRLNAHKALASVALQHTTSSGNVTITGRNFNPTGALVLPDTINGNTVTAIGSSAFSNATGLSQITIPASITSIGSNVFENCTNLASVTLSNNLISIGNAAFKGCSNLNSITIPNSVTSIGSNAFENCTNLASVTLSNNLISIESATFKGCTNLNNITIPSSVTSIGSNAFENCTSLTSITLSDNLVSIGMEAFKGCTSLNNITIPSSVTNIGLNAFEGCTSLNNVTRKFDYNITEDNCYYLIKDNLNSLSLEVDGENILTTSNIVTLYFSVGNHSIKLQGNSISSVINTPVLEKSSQLFTNSNQDIKNSVESGKNVFYFHNFGRRFVTFTLEASGYSPSDYENAIVVRDLNGVIKKFDISGFYNEAESVDGSNTVTVYLSGKGNFYVEVNFSDTTVTELKLTARLINSITQVDLFDLDEEVDSDVWLFNNTTSNGDELKAIEILQPGEFEIKANYNFSQAIDPIFVIIKETIVDYQVVTEVITTGTGIMNPLFTTTLNLEPGKYYIGYFNTAVGEEIDIQINRLVTQSGSQVLVPDLDAWTPTGSQISIMEAGNPISYGQTFITEGFTRLIYINVSSGVSVSRLDYYWYSSDDTIATVSQYGTVLALPVTSDATVKIMAVLKADYSKVFVKEFTILNDLESTTYAYDGNREEMVNDFLDDYTAFYNAANGTSLDRVNLLVPGDSGYNVDTALVARLDNQNATLELFFEDSDLYDKWIWIVEYTMGIRYSNQSLFEAYINGTASGTNSTVKFEICAFLSERFITTWPQSSNYTIDGFANGFWDRLIVNTINIYVNTIIPAGGAIAIPLENAVVPINIIQYYSWSTNDISYVEFHPWGVVSILPSAVGKTVTLYGRYCYNPRVVIIIVAEIV